MKVMVKKAMVIMAAAIMIGSLLVSLVTAEEKARLLSGRKFPVE